MDFTHDDEQKALRDAVRGLLGKAYGDWEDRRRVAAEDPGHSPDTWQRLAEMGVLALPFSEEDGGVGAGVVEIGIVAEELGRVLAPEPFLPCVVLAGGAVAALGSAEQKESLLGPLVEGEALLGWAHAEPGMTGGPFTPTVTARQEGEGWTLSGTKDPVVQGGEAAHLVVSAALPDGGTGLFVVAGDADGLRRTTYSTHDGTRAATVVLEDTAATPLGDGGDASSSLGGILDIARVVAAHVVLGGMARALELTRDYLTSRKQFGVTLNTFQALTFRAADMYVQVELTRSIVQWAAMVLDDATGPEDAGRVHEAATRAALQAATGGRKVFEETIQLHGGIAMTAEYAAGHFLSQQIALEQQLGGRRRYLSALAGRVGSYGDVEPIPDTVAD